MVLLQECSVFASEGAASSEAAKEVGAKDGLRPPRLCRVERDAGGCEHVGSLHSSRLRRRCRRRPLGTSSSSNQLFLHLFSFLPSDMQDELQAALTPTSMAAAPPSMNTA